jgi:hypothetical protein
MFYICIFSNKFDLNRTIRVSHTSLMFAIDIITCPKFGLNGTATLKYINNCCNTNICSYLETSGGQSCNLYLNVVHFSMPVLIRHLWQLKTVVFLHWCLMHVLLFKNNNYYHGLLLNSLHIKDLSFEQMPLH